MAVRVYTDYKSIKTKKALEELSLKELKRMSHDLFAVANKRISRLQNKKDVISPALNALENRRGDNPKFTIGSKNLKQLQREYSEAMAFLNLETSTVTGAKQYENNLKSYVGDADDSTISYIFDLLHSVQERVPESVFGSLAGSVPTLEILTEILGQDTNSNISEFESESDKRESIISDAIDKLTSMIDEQVQHGKDVLQGMTNDFNRLF